MALSLIWTQNINFGIKKLFHFLSQLVVFLSFLFLIKENILTKKHLKIFLYIFISLSSLLSIFIIISNPFTFENFYIKKNFLLTHVYSGKLIAFLLLLLLTIKTKKTNYIHIILIIIYSIALNFTAYRTAIISILISNIIFYLFLLIKKLEDSKLKIIIFFVSMIVGFLYSANLKERIPVEGFFSIKSDLSISARIEALKEGLKLWKENPLLGTGLGGFMSADESDHLRFTLKYPHNIFIEILAELGLLGLSILLILIIRGVMSSLKSSPFYLSLLVFFTIFSLTSKDITINFVILLFPIIISSTSSILKNNI